MLFSQRIDQRHTPQTARRCQRGRRFRPRIEQLDDRLLLATVNWIGGSGDWNVGANWSNGTGPGAGDDAVIDVAGVSVTHSTLSHTVKSLKINDPFLLSGGTLSIGGALSSTSTFTLSGGTLANAAVQAGTTITATQAGGTLNAVTLNGVLDLATNANAAVTVTGGLTLNGIIDVGAADGGAFGVSSYDTLTFAGTQALSTTSSGTIRFGGSPYNSVVVPTGTTLTVNAGVTIHGQSGFIGTGMAASGGVTTGGTLVNHGTIAADGAGAPSPSTPPGSLTIASAVLINTQALQVSNGETLTIGRTDSAWSNSGTISIANGTLTLGGVVSTSALGAFNWTSGTVNLAGTLNNNSSPGLVLDDTTGPWTLAGGTISGGAITTSGSNNLRGSVGGGILNGVTLNGVLDLATNANAAVTVTGGLTLNGIIDVGAADGGAFGVSSYDTLTFAGTQALSTTSSGTIRFGGSPYNSVVVPTGTTLTVNAGVTLHGTSGFIGTGMAASGGVTTGGTLVNHGTIAADGAGAPSPSTPPGTVNIAAGTFTNTASLEVSNGETLIIGRTDSAWSNSGTISIANGTLTLGGVVSTSALGAFNWTSGTVNLAGTLNNNSSPGLVLDDTTGPWTLAGGTISGGAITTSGSNNLRGSVGGGIMNGVTLNGVLDLATNANAAVTVTGGLTLNGIIDVGAADGGAFGVSSYDTLTFAGTQALSTTSSGTIRFGGSPYNSVVVPTGTTLTVNAGVTLHGTSGFIGTGMAASGGVTTGGTLVNHGTIAADGAGAPSPSTPPGTVNIAAGTFTNTASLEVSNGETLIIGRTDSAWSNSGTIGLANGTLTLGGTWSNSGAIQVASGTLNLGGTWSNTGAFQVATSGTLNLGGSFTTAGIGTLTNDRGGVVNVTGTLDNAGSTLALDNTTGSWTMKGGTIVGGRVSTAGAAELVAGGPVLLGTLNGVTLAGTLAGFRIVVTGGLTLEQGLIDVGRLDFNGTQTLGGAGTVVFSTNDPLNDVRVSAGATLTIGPSVTIHGVTGFIGSTSSGRILNQGTIAADGGGTLTVQGISNFASGTLTGGAWQVAGNSILRLIGAVISTNAADILVDGASARLFSDSSSTNALAGLAVNTAAGRLRLDNGANLTTSAGNVNNQGSLTVGAGSTFTANTVTVANGGNLNGAGTIAANVVNNGVVNPGASPATFRVNGSYTQGADGVLNLEIGGTTPGSGYDQLRIAGSATLNGTLAVSPIDGFGPATGQLFEVMTFAGHTGTFSTVNGLSQGRFPLFSLAVNPANVVLNAVANGTDLDFDSFQSGTIPQSAMPGQMVSLTYTVKNLSDPPAAGNWIDSVYLSRDGALEPSDTLLTRVEHVGGVAGLGSYTATATAPLPALIDAGYRVIVVADGRGLVSDGDRANNTGVSAQAISVTVPLLTLGTPVSGSIAPGQNLYYRVLVAPGKDVTVGADFAALPGAEVAVRYAALPDQTNRDDAAPAGPLHPRLVLSNTQGGAYYVRLHGREDAAGSVAYTLTAAASGFEIVSVSPLRGTNQSTTSAIITLRGARFTPQTQVQLRQAGGPIRAAQAVNFISANKLVASFDLVGLPIGSYDFVAQDAGQTSVALDAFTVTDDQKDGSVVWISAIAFVRVGASIKLTLGWNNLGDNPFSAPLVQVRATDVEPDEITTSLTLPGFGILDPFKTYGTHPKNPGTSTFDLIVIEPSKTPMDWDNQKATLRPSTIPPDAWDAVWDNLRPQLGETLADFSLFMSITRLKLREAGEEVLALNRLFNFELQRANNLPAIPVPATAVDVAFPAPGLPLVFGRGFGATIAGRYQLGRLGRGWTDNFDISIRDDTVTGLVTISGGGGARFFKRQDDGSYRGAVGEFATLTNVNGAFQLRERTGAVTAFRADGRLDFLEDTNGNRITGGYTGSQLTNLAHSNGTALTLAYSGGRLRQVTDPAGGVATYEYDASGEHLLRVTTTAGTTEYAYTLDADGPRAHALASITSLAGTHLFFDYNSAGRLVRQQGDGGAATVRFAYDVASYTVTDAQNHALTFFYDDSLRIRRIVDALGGVSTIQYDASNRPVIVGASGGGEGRLDYDALGNPTSVQDPLGETHEFAYERDRSRLVTSTDALGHETQFNHDARGNLTATTHVDGSTQQYSYDAQGNVVGTVNRLGQNIRLTYNSSGQVTRKDLPDGTHVDYSYNARGNLETVMDTSGTTRLEYRDSNPDLLTKITYPTGRFLEYTYQNGRRTRMVDQSGFAVNYSYDAAGRLDVLRDGGDILITDYDYDPVSRLARETHGNGTFTEYGYDNAGQVTEITHRAPDASILSQFVYAYDNLGRRASMTTPEGTTAYGYDGAGRLTSVLLPSGRAITYAYDAAGNRTIVTDNGMPTTYTVSELNQYLAVGADTQTFDAAGNLVSNSDDFGRTNYRYDVEGRLLGQITPQGTWTYEYDVFGNRIASSLNGVRTQYLVDPFGRSNVVAEYDVTGALQAHYVHGFGLESRVDAANQSAYYQFDAVGNTTALTGSGGTVLNSYSYLPFGEALTVSETVANSFEFVGEYGVMREGSGLDYMRNRWYDPRQGRFTQADPIGLAGGANLYAYVGNNPASFVDPSGLQGTMPFHQQPVLNVEGVIIANPGGIGAGTAANGTTLPGSAEAASDLMVRNASAMNAAERAGLGVSSTGSAGINANPLGNTVGGPGGISESAFRAGQAELHAADLRAARPGGGLPAAGAVTAIFIGVDIVTNAISQLNYFRATGEMAPCTDHVALIAGVADISLPHSLQACEDPGSNVLEKIAEFFTNEKAIQRLLVQRASLSTDPNDIVGPAGFGAEGFVVPQATLPYLIRFQNLPAAEGPAAEVVVIHVLDADLDLDTFELDDFGFGDITVPVPAGRQSYSTRIDLRELTTPARQDLFVDVSATLDRATRMVTWRLQAIDPETLDLPISPFVGFLPPDKVAPEGQGFVSFSIRAKEASPTGTRIEAQARIVFDTNDPIDTNIAVNTIDVGPPSSSVNPLPSVTETTSFIVGWSGTDDADGKRGSGIAAYDVYVSDNGAPFELFRSGTRESSLVFSGLDGHSYRFYTVATDNVGHLEQVPTAADTQTRIVEKVDFIPPAVRIVPVSPSPRLTPVEQISLVFSEPVTGFDISDLTFTQTFDRPVSLLPGDARLSSTDNLTWTFSNLASLTPNSGVYQLEVNVANSGIADFAGNPLAIGASASWSMRPGDANADRRFNSSDLVAVFRTGEYEDLTAKNSTWSEGDWNGDGDFTSTDLVVSFQSGGYVQEAVPAVLAADVAAAVSPAVRGNAKWHSPHPAEVIIDHRARPAVSLPAVSLADQRNRWQATDRVLTELNDETWLFDVDVF